MWKLKTKQRNTLHWNVCQTYEKQALLCSVKLGSIKFNLETAKFVEKRGNYSRNTAKIGICTPLKSDIYFRFVTETIVD